MESTGSTTIKMPILPQITVLISNMPTREVLLKTPSPLLTTLASKIAHQLLKDKLTTTTTFSFLFTLIVVCINDHRH